MAGGGIGQNTKFSIEDAFDEACEDAIRVYGSTTKRSPLKTRQKTPVPDGSVTVRLETPGQPRLSAVLNEDATSKDSDSLIKDDGCSSEYDYDPSEPCWRHPKIKENWKMVLAAVALLIIGIGLFIVGIALTTISGLQGLVFFIAGFICFIPGAYHIVYIYFAVKGKRGYYFYHLPLFN